MKPKKSVLFVCTGNLCRSPMAEGIFRDLIGKSGKKWIRVSSAGTWGLDGEPAAPHSVTVAQKHGIDISEHRARRLTQEMIEEADLILVMEFDHLQSVLDLVPESEDKVKMLTQYGKGRKNYPESIQDPYGRSKKVYDKCYEKVEKHVKALFKEITADDP